METNNRLQRFENSGRGFLNTLRDSLLQLCSLESPRPEANSAEWLAWIGLKQDFLTLVLEMGGNTLGDVQQHPWPLLTRCWEQPKTTKCLRTLSNVPGGQHWPWLRSAAAERQLTQTSWHWALSSGLGPWRVSYTSVKTEQRSVKVYLELQERKRGCQRRKIRDTVKPRFFLKGDQQQYFISLQFNLCVLQSVGTDNRTWMPSIPPPKENVGGGCDFQSTPSCRGWHLFEANE